jgi:hypothetical protein
VAPYLARHRCKDIEVAIDNEPDPDLDARYCTVTFTPPTRGKTVDDLYRLARGLQEFLVVLDYGGFTMQTLPILLRAGRASMLIGREEGQWLEVKSAPYDLTGDHGKIELKMQPDSPTQRPAAYSLWEPERKEGQKLYRRSLLRPFASSALPDIGQSWMLESIHLSTGYRSRQLTTARTGDYWSSSCRRSLSY